MTTDSLARLNRRIATEIPLAHAAGIRLEADDTDTLVAHAPFGINSNPHGTAFGGSLYVAALVAGYAQTVRLVDQARLDATVVIRHANADYRQPFHGDIIARAEPVADKTHRRFLKTMHRHGRSRLDMTITVADTETLAFVLHTRFAAITNNHGEAPPTDLD